MEGGGQAETSSCLSPAFWAPAESSSETCVILGQWGGGSLSPKQFILGFASGGWRPPLLWLERSATQLGEADAVTPPPPSQPEEGRPQGQSLDTVWVLHSSGPAGTRPFESLTPALLKILSCGDERTEGQPNSGRAALPRARTCWGRVWPLRGPRPMMETFNQGVRHTNVKFTLGQGCEGDLLPWEYHRGRADVIRGADKAHHWEKNVLEKKACCVSRLRGCRQGVGSGTERWSGSSPADRRGRGGWGPDGAGLTDGSDPTRLWGLGWGLRQKSCMEVRQRPERAPGPRRGAEAGPAQGPSGAGLALQTAGEEGVSQQWVTWLRWAGPETPRTRKELSVPDPSGLPAKGHWGPCRQSGPRGGAEGGWLVQRGDRRPPPRGSRAHWVGGEGWSPSPADTLEGLSCVPCPGSRRDWPTRDGTVVP